MANIENYKKYDFEGNATFQAFVKSLNPPCPPNAIEFVKRHWYKKEIDNSFVPNFDGSLPDFEKHEHSHNGQKCTGHHNH